MQIPDPDPSVDYLIEGQSPHDPVVSGTALVHPEVSLLISMSLNLIKMTIKINHPFTSLLFLFLTI
jgi:hypothetical protein